jgi:hypothetical protein
MLAASGLAEAKRHLLVFQSTACSARPSLFFIACVLRPRVACCVEPKTPRQSFGKDERVTRGARQSAANFHLRDRLRIAPILLPAPT